LAPVVVKGFIKLLQRQFICWYDTDTAQEPGSQFWCHAMMRLQFAHVRSFAFRGRLRNLSAASLLRNNNTAVNLQTFTSNYGSRRFSACD